MSNCSDPDYVQKLAKNVCTSVQICALGAYAYSHSLNIHVQLSSGFRYIHFIGYGTFVYPIQALEDDLNIMLINAKRHFNIYKHDKFRAQLSCKFLVIGTFLS